MFKFRKYFSLVKTSVEDEIDKSLGKSEKGFYYLTDIKNRPILSWYFPGFKPPEEKESLRCASDKYIKSMSVSARLNDKNNVFLRTYFIFNDTGVRHSTKFFKENDLSEIKPHFRISGRDRDLILYKGEIDDSMFDVLYYQNTGDTALVIDNIIYDRYFSKKPVFTSQTRRTKGKRPRQRIIETTDETNELFYNTLVENYKLFEPVLK